MLQILSDFPQSISEVDRTSLSFALSGSGLYFVRLDSGLYFVCFDSGLYFVCLDTGLYHVAYQEDGMQFLCWESFVLVLFCFESCFAMHWLQFVLSFVTSSLSYVKCCFRLTFGNF